MTGNLTSTFRRSAAQCFFGGLGLVLLTFICFRLGLNLVTTSFAYLILLAIVSLMGSFIASGILSIVAAAALTYFFAPPIFDLRADQQDALALAAFLTTTMIVVGLTTKRKRTEGALRQSEVYLSEAQRLSRTGSLGWDVATGAIFWSEQTFRIFEYDRRTKPTLARVLERTHPGDLARVQQVIDRASHAGQDFALEHRVQMPDGKVKYVYVVAHASRDESGDRKFVGAVMDITERKLAEAERERLGHRLRQAEKMEAVGRLAGGIAHDFNNVLSGILAYGDMLFEEAPADSPRKHYAQNVLTAATRGRALVEQILAYSRSQRGKRVPTDICRTVAETLELVRGSLPVNIRLDLSAPKTPLVVLGDPTQLHQVVMNLCSNAIQAMSAGGTLRVALEPAELSADHALSHGTLKPGRYVRLSVADSGTGMDEATLSRIFEPFFTTKDIGRGTGLGLSIVYAIVADSGGAIDVKSAVKQGSTFAIYLPLVEIGLPAAAETEARHD
jgi:signal transduction histidine kinase